MEYTIYTRANFKCPFCEKAARLLDVKGMSYSMRPLDTPALLEVAESAGMTTVPIIYHGDELVGGYDKLEALLSR